MSFEQISDTNGFSESFTLNVQYRSIHLGESFEHYHHPKIHEVRAS